MPSDYQSVSDKPVTLDKNPPSPPEIRGSAGKSGLGEMAKSPGLMALQGLESIENGMQMITVAIPNLGPILGLMATLVTRLRQAVPQALSGGGSSPLGASSMLTPPPGSGIGAPPGIGAQGGAPGAPTPLPPGMG